MRTLLLFLTTAVIAAAQTSDWGVVKRLATHDKVRVATSDGKTYNGQLAAVTDNSLSVVTASGEEMVPRAAIKKVAARGPSHRGRNALIGLGIGAGAGLATGAAADAGTSWDVGKVLFTPMGAIAGTLIGVAWPTGGWHDVYRVK